MGVQIYLLDRRTVTLLIDGEAEEIGALRQFWKVTEIDGERAAEIDAVKQSLQSRSAPLAVMIAEACNLPLANEPSLTVPVHLVLGWDEDRVSVTDSTWDYLPVLGHAVRTASSAGYALHEERDGLLYPLSKGRAIKLNILNEAGQLVRRGQPSIVECKSVKPYLALYAEADCVLSDGRAVEILTAVKAGILPSATWYAGKRPADVATYSADTAA
jgi:hypothetical protein